MSKFVDPSERIESEEKSVDFTRSVHARAASRFLFSASNCVRMRGRMSGLRLLVWGFFFLNSRARRIRVPSVVVARFSGSCSFRAWDEDVRVARTRIVVQLSVLLLGIAARCLCFD